jgi:hypothetical protein
MQIGQRSDLQGSVPSATASKFVLPPFHEYCNIGGTTTKSPPVLNLGKFESVVDHVIEPCASFTVYVKFRKNGRAPGKPTKTGAIFSLNVCSTGSSPSGHFWHTFQLAGSFPRWSSERT